MKQLLLIVSIFIFEGITLWGIGEKAGLHHHYDKFMNYPVAEKSASVKNNGNMLADNIANKPYCIALHIDIFVK